MTPRLVLEITHLAFPIRLHQIGQTFRVTYGQQVWSKLSYEEAGQKMGLAMMHAAACDGLITQTLTLAA